MNLFLKLLLAHLLSDFFLQTDQMVRGKEESSPRRYAWLTLHALVHAVVTAFLLWEKHLIWVSIVIFFTHFVIDSLKSYFKPTLPIFIIDQVLHIIVLLLVACYLRSDVMEWINIWISNQNVVKCAIGYLLILRPTSIFMGLLLRKWEVDSLPLNGLPNAGRWIGYAERIMTLSFILCNYPEGIGFLIASKSIFRYGDLTNAKDIKATEYVLLGTLTSFGIAIAVGLLLVNSCTA